MRPTPPDAAVLALALLCGPSVAHMTGVPVQPGTQNDLNQLVKIQQGWGPQTSTDHLILSLVETSRSGGSITFRLRAPDAPKNKKYSLINWPVTSKQPIQQLQGVTLNESGVAVCAGTPGTCGDPATPNDPIDTLTTPVPGEPVRLGLISEGGAVRLFAGTVSASS